MDTKVILAELYAERKRIDQAIAAMEELNGVAPVASKAVPAANEPAPARKAGRRISAAGRQRIAEAAKKRWAERRRKLGTPSKEVTGKTGPRRKMSEAAKQRIAEAARKRWAERKKAEKKA